MLSPGTASSSWRGRLRSSSPASGREGRGEAAVALGVSHTSAIEIREILSFVLVALTQFKLKSYLVATENEAVEVF